MEIISDSKLLEELKTRFDKNKRDLEELQKLNNELAKLNKKLEDSEALKSHFISNIANEIINPFSSILALSKSILTVKKEDWKTVISMVALIHSEAFNLDFQLKNIFMAAQIEAGYLDPEILEVDIKTLTEKIIDSFKVECNKKQLKTKFITKVDNESSKELIFKTDPEKLKLILTNILNNAIKFSDNEKEIEIKMVKLSSNLKIAIIDHGPGIEEEEQKIIFDRFKKINNGIHNLNRGHGLGLAVTKALVDILQGKIEIFSKKNIGTNITIILPSIDVESIGFASDGDEILFDSDQSF